MRLSEYGPLLSAIVNWIGSRSWNDNFHLVLLLLDKLNQNQRKYVHTFVIGGGLGYTKVAISLTTANWLAVRQKWTECKRSNEVNEIHYIEINYET